MKLATFCFCGSFPRPQGSGLCVRSGLLGIGLLKALVTIDTLKRLARLQPLAFPSLLVRSLPLVAKLFHLPH